MAYFTAVIARSGRVWRARDLEIGDFESLDELADALRSAGVGDEPVLAVIEHEDEWFALVRVDGEEEPRIFVSDLPASSRSHYAAVLAPAADVDAELEDDVPAPDEGEGEDPAAADGAEDEPEPPPPAPWAGEPDILEDLGVTGRSLRMLVEGNGDDPAAVLAEVGDAVGFGELIEALR